MNCFHFSVSLRYTTTDDIFFIFRSRLWIAFIFQYLWDTQQRQPRQKRLQYRCELLSFFSIFEIHNNLIVVYKCTSVVVNCFHFSVSLRYTTTSGESKNTGTMLWIAFIFQYLWDTQQQICVLNCLRSVVNCFHFSVSLRYTTTVLHVVQFR